VSHIDDLIEELAPDGVGYRDLGSVITLNFGARVTKMADAGTRYPVYGGGGESFRTDDFNREDEYVVSRFAMSAKCVRKVAGKFWMLDSGFTFEPADESVDKDYVAYVLFNMQPEIYAQKNLKTKEFKRFRIPVPPLKVQREIVRILDNFTGLEVELEARRTQFDFYRESLIAQAASAATQVSLGEIVDLNWGDTNITKSAYVNVGERYLAYSAAGPDGSLDHVDNDRPACRAERNRRTRWKDLASVWALVLHQEHSSPVPP
jgi:type I restriction enzyme S subunit